MKTQTTLGPFITFMLTIEAEQQRANNVVNHPQARLLVLRPLLRFMAISQRRQLAEEARCDCLVFRIDSSRPCRVRK